MRFHGRGDYYTWTNKQQGTDRVYSRLDREIANDEWMLQYGHLTTIFGEPFISYHVPILIPFRPPQNHIKVPFRFFNIWADHINFRQIVDEGWSELKQ